MSVSTPHPDSSIDLSDAVATIEDADLDSPVEDAVTTLADTALQLTERVRDLEDRVGDVEDTTEDLEDRAEDAGEHREMLAKDLAGTQSRVADLEDGTSGDKGGGSDTETPAPDTSVTPETALEDVTALPEHVAEESLSANQSRARFVARDVAEYTKSVPAGRALTAGDLSTVLRAGTDCRGHSQTVDRVIRLLDDLGGEDVRVVETQGQRRVVFTEDCARRLARLSESQSHSGDSERGVTV